MAKEYKYIYPTTGVITQVFGLRKPPVAGSTKYHPGVDIGNDIGTQLLASSGGKIFIPPYHRGYGHRIYITHSDGNMSYYSHVSKILVEHNDIVRKGQLIGRMGSTGEYTTGPHLHFGIQIKNSQDVKLWVNPFDYIGSPENTIGIRIKTEWVEKLRSGLWINKSARTQAEYVKYVTDLEKGLVV